MDPSEQVVHVEPGVVPDDLAAFAVASNASFFQSPTWLALVGHVDARYRPWIACVRDGNQQLLAALPLFEVQEWGTRRLYGGPWGTYSGIVSRDASATSALIDWMQQQPGRFALIRVHDFGGSLSALDARWDTLSESTQVVQLPEDPQDLYEGAFTSQNRNKIRKSEKNHVHVTCRHDAAALHRYADLYERLARRLSVKRPIPRGLFTGLAGCEGVQVWLAQRQEETIAALLNLRWGGQIMNWGNVSSPDSWKYAPNNLLHWKALEHACLDVEGPRLYNFGSSAVSDKVYTFKKSFGAVDRTYPCREAKVGWLRMVQRLRGRKM